MSLLGMTVGHVTLSMTVGHHVTLAVGLYITRTMTVGLFCRFVYDFGSSGLPSTLGGLLGRYDGSLILLTLLPSHWIL